MEQWGRVVASLLASSCLAIVACAESSTPSSPSVSFREAGSAPSGGEGRRIQILDQCDPDTFNAEIGPGACTNRQGGIAFEQFIAILTRHGSVPSWKFSPDMIHVSRDQTLTIANGGGETHTFTEVEEFGGGIVPNLNQLSGVPVPAPECLALTPADFIASGAQATHTFERGEREKYQCCIHPWMRAVTR